MYTVVSVVIDLAGEPDTIDFTSPSFGAFAYCYGSFGVGGLKSASSHLTCAHITRLDPRWWVGGNWFLSVLILELCSHSFQDKHCSFPPFIPIFLLSHRAPVRAILPYIAPCLPRRIFRTRMSTVLNLDRRLRHPETLYPGTCRDMSGPREKSREDLCWIRRRELCSGSQVSGSRLNIKILDSDVL